MSTGCCSGIVPNSTLYKISNDMQSLLLVAIVLTLGVGLVSSYLVSRGLAHPIRQLSDEVAAIQDKRTEIPKLSRTGIREIDGFSTAITQLSQDILDTSTKFLRIMDMASIELGGYEIREDSDKVFVTDNFFSMLGMQDANPNDVTRERFEMLMEELVLQKETSVCRMRPCVHHSAKGRQRAVCHAAHHRRGRGAGRSGRGCDCSDT